MQSTESGKWNAPGSEEPDSGRRSKAMIITLKGLKAWGSGIVVMVMSAGFTMLMTEAYVESMSIWEMVVLLFIIFPLALGITQNWYWSQVAYEEPESE